MKRINRLFICAADQGALPVIQWIYNRIAARLDVNLLDVVNTTTPCKGPALYFAAAKGHIHVVKYLTSVVNVYVECRNQQQDTPLQGAAQNGHVGVVRFLVEEANADATVSCNEASTPLYTAAQHGHCAVVEFLCRHFATTASCERHAVDIIDSQVFHGFTPTYVAACNGHWQCVRILYQCGADPTRRSSDDSTPLVVASQNGHTDVVRYILSSAASSSVVSVPLDGPRALWLNKYPPLYIATHHGHADVVRLLCEHGAQVNSRAGNEGTALYVACLMNRVDVVRVLLQQPTIDVNMTFRSYTPLYVACQKGHTQVVQLLLHHPDIIVNCTTEKGTTPIYIASEKDNAEVVQLLLVHGADPNIQSNSGLTSLHAAAQRRSIGSVRVLLKHPQTALNIIDNMGQLPDYELLNEDQNINYLIQQERQRRNCPNPNDTNM